jgi:uncharacterized membrane protein YfcA
VEQNLHLWAGYAWLVPVGFIVGAFGTLIGAGGGFILVPLLLLLYPDDSPELIASISLAVVFFNATSGSLAYARMKRVDFKSGMIFSVATVPGAVIGAFSTAYIPRRLFDQIFAVLMIAAATYLLVRPMSEAEVNSGRDGNSPDNSRWSLTRTVIDAEGKQYVFSYNALLGIGLSVAVGFVSSFLGVGGGFIHVPALVHLLNFPVHLATATSHFILAIMALAGTAVHVLTGTFAHGFRRTIALAIGVLFGAQLGAFLSNRVHAAWIIRALAIALAFVGMRILSVAW